MVYIVKVAPVALVVVLLAAPAGAQQPRTVAGPAVTTTPSGSAPIAKSPIVPLAVRVVITRAQDGKPPASRPYELQVAANDNAGASITSAVDVLIPMLTVGEKTVGPNYKDVGTSIKCSASSIDGGRFRVNVDLEDESVMPDPKLPSDGNHGPWLQVFRAEQVLVLKDGQTSEFASGIDRVTGELVKIAVTLNVVK